MIAMLRMPELNRLPSGEKCLCIYFTLWKDEERVRHIYWRTKRLW